MVDKAETTTQIAIAIHECRAMKKPHFRNQQISFRTTQGPEKGIAIF